MPRSGTTQKQQPKGKSMKKISVVAKEEDSDDSYSDSSGMSQSESENDEDEDSAKDGLVSPKQKEVVAISCWVIA